MKNIQIVWWRDWHFHFGFVKGNPLKKPLAFHIIYKWGIWLGCIEIRKFLTEEERTAAIKIYINGREERNST
jgi:hypothetical protein